MDACSHLRDFLALACSGPEQGGSFAHNFNGVRLLGPACVGEQATLGAINLSCPAKPGTSTPSHTPPFGPAAGPKRRLLNPNQFERSLVLVPPPKAGGKEGGRPSPITP